MSQDQFSKSEPLPPNPAAIARLLKRTGRRLPQDDAEPTLAIFGQFLGNDAAPARPVFPKFNRKETRHKITAILLQLCLEHPEWSCNRLTQELRDRNVIISANSVYAILVEHQLSTKRERLAKLQEKLAEDSPDLTPLQIALLEKMNIWFKERNFRGTRPGEVLAQDTAYVGNFKNLGEIHLQAVIDTYSSYAFGLLNPDNRAEHSVAILHSQVLPFFRRLHLPVALIDTDKGREYSGKEDHLYGMYLKLCAIEQRRTGSKQFPPHSFIRRFQTIAISEFFEKIDRAGLVSVAQLQSEFNGWLYRYNHIYPFQGYPNMGRPPVALIQKHLEGKEAHAAAPDRP
jgi:hypothetical protein